MHRFVQKIKDRLDTDMNTLAVPTFPDGVVCSVCVRSVRDVFLTRAKMEVHSTYLVLFEAPLSRVSSPLTGTLTFDKN